MPTPGKPLSEYEYEVIARAVAYILVSEAAEQQSEVAELTLLADRCDAQSDHGGHADVPGHVLRRWADGWTAALVALAEAKKREVPEGWLIDEASSLEKDLLVSASWRDLPERGYFVSRLSDRNCEEFGQHPAGGFDTIMDAIRAAEEEGGKRWVTDVNGRRPAVPSTPNPVCERGAEARKSKWSPDWPTEPGWYWFFGKRFGTEDCPTTLEVAEVRQGSVMAFGTSGHHLLRELGATGLWLPLETPELPEEVRP
jgi:hypothetical protein